MPDRPPTPAPFQIFGNLVDIFGRRIYPAAVTVENGVIASIQEQADERRDSYLLPGFLDAHVHVESSMLLPSEFARAAVVHGTVATISDPHEIANVLGVEGVQYMLDNAAKVPFNFFFGAPSCVPATPFETAGDEVTAEQVSRLLDDERTWYLSEMMNYPGVLSGDATVMAKIHAAQAHNKPVDGHAPGLRGDDALRYVEAGISTDHECYTLEEAQEKLSYGCKIQIREGSAARNFEALFPLIDAHPDACMFSSDDKHPDDLLAGHINELVRRAVAQGADLMNVLQCACVNPVLHYGIPVGLLRVGDRADFIQLENLESFAVLETFIGGRKVAENGRSLIEPVPVHAVNRFHAGPKRVDDFRARAKSSRVNVIVARDGELITDREVDEAKIEGGAAVSDPARDLLKMTVVNRYQQAPPSIAFVRNFGLKRGAIASSVAHDSHNVIAVGVSDDDLCAAVNLVIEAGGGLSVADGRNQEVLRLEVAGLMSRGSCDEVAAAYARLSETAKEMGSKLRAPFMTLSFMALLLIPELKLSDKGLFDGNRFEFVELFV